MKNYTILFLSFCSILLQAQPLTPSDSILSIDSLQVSCSNISPTLVSDSTPALIDSIMPQAVELTLDESLYAWMKQYALDSAFTMPDTIVRCTDSVYSERLKALPFEMQMSYNRYIRSYIERYVVRGKSQTANLLGLSEYYFPIFETYLNKYNLPLELRYLPIIESGLKPTVKSHAGAAGLWQFMVGTGRIYGLEINSLVDERCDPIKSTEAACKFLSNLFQIYKDWNLVIAAYNCGPGNVNKAIRRSGGKRDYWAIYPYLPRETRNYVPVFVGATYAMNYHEQHYIYPNRVDLPILVDTISTNKRIHLKQIAEVLNIPLDEVRRLNPQYRKDVVPGMSKSYNICLPLHKATEFIAQEDSILSHRADELINSQFAQINAAQKNTSDIWGNGDVIYYKVKSGDTLGHIAQRYRVYVSQLKRWNNISGTNIRIGQRIRIYK